MRVVVDQWVGRSGEVEAVLAVHTEVAPWNKVAHPTLAGQAIDVRDFLALLTANAALRGAAGYNDLCTCPEHAPGKTRWQHLVDAGVV